MCGSSQKSRDAPVISPDRPPVRWIVRASVKRAANSWPICSSSCPTPSSTISSKSRGLCAGIPAPRLMIGCASSNRSATRSSSGRALPALPGTWTSVHSLVVVHQSTVQQPIKQIAQPLVLRVVEVCLQSIKIVELDDGGEGVVLRHHLFVGAPVLHAIADVEPADGRNLCC